MYHIKIVSKFKRFLSLFAALKVLRCYQGSAIRFVCLITRSGFIPGNVGRMDAIVRCGRCLAGGRGCLLKGPYLIPSLKFRLPYLINVHQPIDPFLLKSRDMYRVKPRLINVCGSLNCSFIMVYAMLTTFISHSHSSIQYLRDKKYSTLEIKNKSVKSDQVFSK